MSKSQKPSSFSHRFQAFLKSPAALPALAGLGALFIILSAALILWAVRSATHQPVSASSDSTSWVEPADDKDYTTADKVSTSALDDTVLPSSEDAGAEYITETLFLGDSNTVRYMMYSENDSSKKPLTGLNNNIGVTSMGVTSITSLKCQEFQGQADKVTMPQAVKILQPKRIIIGFGTNNLTMETDTFIKEYKKGLKAIHEAYPYADLIVNAIPPLDKERENGRLSMKQVDRLNTAIAKMCEAEGYKFLNSSEALEDPTTGWAKKDYTLGDGVHLNQNGVRALFEYIRTHAYITEDTRPKPLKPIPKVIGVPAGLISNDPIAVRGARVPVEFIVDGEGTLEGATSQNVKKGQQTSTVTAVAAEGWEFTGWSASIGHVDGAATMRFTVPEAADANGVLLTAHFREQEVEIEPTPTPSPSPSPTPLLCSCKTFCDPLKPNLECLVCASDPTKCVGLKPCTCTVKCTSGVPNPACERCKTKPDKCGATGTTPAPSPTPGTSATPAPTPAPPTPAPEVTPAPPPTEAPVEPNPAPETTPTAEPPPTEVPDPNPPAEVPDPNPPANGGEPGGEETPPEATA